jgi:hypothetical protein
LSELIAVSYLIVFSNDFNDLFQVFQTCDKHEQEEKVLFYILLFVGLGLLMLFTMFFQVTI